MNIADETEEYADFVRPKVGNLLKLLKLDQVFESASGDFLYYKDKKGQIQPVLDLLGGYGSTLLGHYHPLLVAEFQAAVAEKTPIHSQLSIRREATLLAKDLNHCLLQSETQAGLPTHSQNYVCTFANSGTEAVEASIKHSLMQWSKKKESLLFHLSKHLIRSGIQDKNKNLDVLQVCSPVLVAAEGSFHGKTAASLAATWNTDFKAMYPIAPLEVRFLRRDSVQRDIEGLFEELEIPFGDGQSISRICAFIYEPIQCEGGVRPLSYEFLSFIRKMTQKNCIPMIADEIQSGFWRTGCFLASHQMGLSPDYVLLGKSLGGGLCKISALMIAEEMQVEDFDYVHTSTFAEDGLSSRIARRALNIASKGQEKIAQRAEAIGQLLRARLADILEKYPGVISEVRGQGFLYGIQFDFSVESPASDFFRAINQTGFASYLMASYLLNRHSIRVGVTLSQPETLRIEPSILIEDAQLFKFFDALEDLCRLIFEKKLLALTAHFWKCEIPSEKLDLASPKLRKTVAASGIPVVAFLGHVIDSNHLCKMDPLFKELPDNERRRFLEKFGPSTGPLCCHEQIIKGANGRKVHAKFFGALLASDFFETSLRRDRRAYQKVEEMFQMALDVQAKHIGLGQFTSIVSENGLLLRNAFLRADTCITTGNSLTAGFAFQALIRALARKEKDLRDCRVGIVGASGNICNVLAQLIGDLAAALTLVHHETPETSPKFRAAIETILSHSRMSAKDILATNDLAQLENCDAVILGTNSTQKILKPEHLKDSAIVIDFSVPTNIDPRVPLERPDVECSNGELATLPLGQSIDTSWIPTPVGETFACMAETLTVALHGYVGDFTLGPISKARVIQALQMSKEAGFTLGSAQPLYRYPNSLRVSPAMPSAISY